MTENGTETPRQQNNTEHSSIRRRAVMSAAVMLLLPFICSFGLNFLYTYYAGDLEHQLLPSVLDILIQLSGALIPHMFSGFLLWWVYRFGVKKSAPVIAAALAGALVPYLSMFIIEALLGSIAIYYKMYLRYSLLYLFDAALIALTAALVPAFRRLTERRKPGKKPGSGSRNGTGGRTGEKTASGSRNGTGRRTGEKTGAGSRSGVSGRAGGKRKKRMPAVLFKASLCAAAIRLIIGISSEIYYAAAFFDALANEYYRAIYPGELLSMICLFALQFVYAALGLVIIRTEIKLLEKAPAADAKIAPAGN